MGSISLGLVAYLVADIRQRRAFLDTRQSFEMRLTIEDQAREQVIQLKGKRKNSGRYVVVIQLSGTIASVRVTGARCSQDASRPWNGTRRTIQEDLHESSRKRQVCLVSM